MRHQPNRDYTSDDVVQTPPALARRLVEHFKPQGRVLEPCKGEGNVLRALQAHAKRNAEMLKTETLKCGESGRQNAETLKAETLKKGSGGGREISRATDAVAEVTAREVSDFSFQLSGFPRTSRVAWCEISLGHDFFAWTEKVDWIVTNPPWSQIRPFLRHAMSVADHVVFLMTINHVWTKARLRDIREAGFGLKEIVLVDMPRSFPQSGFQLGAVYVARGWKGQIRLTNLES